MWCHTRYLLCATCTYCRFHCNENLVTIRAWKSPAGTSRLLFPIIIIMIMITMMMIILEWIIAEARSVYLEVLGMVAHSCNSSTGKWRQENQEFRSFLAPEIIGSRPMQSFVRSCLKMVMVTMLIIII